jgi:hypothetical protein
LRSRSLLKDRYFKGKTAVYKKATTAWATLKLIRRERVVIAMAFGCRGLLVTSLTDSPESEQEGHYHPFTQGYFSHLNLLAHYK